MILMSIRNAMALAEDNNKVSPNMTVVHKWLARQSANIK